MSKNKLVFITEARFFYDSNNVIYYDKDFDTKLWDRYLEHFDELTIFARVQKVECDYASTLFANNNSRVKFVQLPYFLGLLALLKNIFQLKRILKNNIYLFKDYSFILRVPGTIGFNAAKILNKLQISYSAEVVGDPADVFAQGNFNHPLRPILRFIAIFQLKYVVKNAVSVLYVTQRTLQKRYSCSNISSSFGISDVRIEDSIIKLESKKHNVKQIYQIISVGSLAQMYKSPDVLIDAIKIINERSNNFKVRLIWLGDGIYKEKMIEYSKSIGIDGFIDFLGNVTREEVLSKVYDSDLFVLASRTEGLPRVIIEAMAMGIPIVATNVGGIPELLSDKVLVKPSNSVLLAEKILYILTNSDFYNEQAYINLNNSLYYKKSYLDQQRKEFYKSIV